MMKVAPTIVFLFKDPDGFGEAIADALHPNPNSSVSRLEESFELSLERYGIKDLRACGNLVHFIDGEGNYQVSLLLVEKYEPPTLVCALNEVLTHLIGELSSGLPSLIAPFVVTSSKLKQETKNLTIDSSNILLYCAQIGPETDITRAIATKTQNPPLSLQIHYEPLACFLQLVRVLKLPTSVLIGQRGRGLSDKAFEEEFQILFEIGDLLANTTCLHFLREKIMWKPAKASRDTQEPWRALYG